MKLLIATGLLLVTVSASEHRTGLLIPKDWEVWHRKLKPYPKPEPWAKDPLYLEAVNKGQFNKQLTADVSFARDTIVNFGVKSGTLHGQVLALSQPNTRSAHSAVESLNLVRTGCPPHFIGLFLRKVNQLRQRHQAGPVHLNNSLTDWAVQMSLIKGIKEDGDLNDAGMSILRYISRDSSPDINMVERNVEDMVESFYMDGLKKWRMYGKQANASYLKQEDVQNFLTLLNAESKGVGVFCKIHHKGLKNPVTGVENWVKINFVMDNFNLKTISRNVFPPGYFNWDKKVIGTGGDKKKLVNKQKFDA